MVDFVTSIAAKIGEYLVAPIGRRLGYLLCYKCNTEDFREKVENLKTERAAVQLRVDAAERNGEVILPNVQDWLTRVNEITEVFDEVQANKRCFYGHCPDLMSRYQRSKKAKKKTAEADDLKRDAGRFHIGVSCPAPPPAIGATSSTDAEVFESRKLIFEKIMEALKDDQINMIGIYGMGGVGKTTLVKEVAKQAENHKDQFDEVVMAVVSQTPSFIKIQDEIADKLGLKFDGNSESGRARKLFARLTQKKRILVILDDIWERVELEAIGIPSGANHKGCKIVLTSRKKDVCDQMGTQKDFSINILSEPEAWTLFSKMVGDSVDSPLLRPTAVEVAKECGGLPLAIAVVARALRNKDLSFWHDALNRLQKSIQEKDVSLALELSYTHLESEEAKYFFLLCSLFPEDQNIAIEDLLKYGIGLGLFQDVDTVDEAIVRANTLVYNLKYSCLLLEGYNNEHVRMHDVVRDVAISIASKENRVFLVKAGLGLKEWPKEDTYEPYTAISIMSNNIHDLPDGLECPNLQILFLDRNGPSLQFPENFFLGMENLKVLKMSRIYFLSLPPSLRYLKNLRTLCLDDCTLKDISIIGELKKLQVLSVSGSDIKELPKEMGMLTHLRLLDLRSCEELAVIQPDVIGGLSQLEGLYMPDSFDKWEIEGQQNQRSNASIVELNHLSRLTVLETRIPDANLLPEDSLFHNLSRFRISIGTGFLSRVNLSWLVHTGRFSKFLSLKVHVSAPLKNGINVLLKKAEHLHLREMKGLKSMIYGLDRDGFPNLRRLDVEACDDVEYVFDATEGVSPKAFHILEILVLSHLANLKEICHGQLPTGLFSELQAVKVDGCNGLKNLFSHSIAKDLSKLVELRVANCEIMEEIFGNEKEAASAMDDDIVFPHLRSLALRNLPNLRNFCSKMKCLALKGDVDSHTEDPLLDKKDAFPALETLVINGVGNFEEMWFPQFPAMSFSLLKVLRLYHCDKVLNIVLPKLRNLEELQVRYCDLVEGLAVEEGHAIQTLSQLTNLKLVGLPKLKHVWKDLAQHVCFRNLRVVEVDGCNELKNLFSHSIAKDLCKLDELKVTNCEIMEEIFGNEKEAASAMDDDIVFPHLRRLKLSYLPNLRNFCSKMKCLALKGDADSQTEDPLLDKKDAFPALETLEVVGVSNFEEMWFPQFLAMSFSLLKSLSLCGCDEVLNIFLLNLLPRLQNLEELSVRECDSVEELIEVEGLTVEEGRVIQTLSQLTTLSLWKLPKLKHLWWDKWIPHATLGFLNLRQLYINECHGVKSLFSPYIAICLVQLKYVTIRSCQMIETIISEEREGEENRIETIVFPQLYILNLQNLPKLISFYTGRCTLNWPSLKYLRIRECSAMKSFTCRYSSVQKQRTNDEIMKEASQEYNLDDPIQPLFYKEVTFPTLDNLQISGLENLEDIWHPQLPVESFPGLRILKVESCHKLLNLFPSNWLQGLKNLQEVSIVKCNSVEKIFEIDGPAGEGHASISLFQLEDVELRDLPNLKVFYPGNDNLALPSLATLKLVDCPKMETFSFGFISKPKLEKVEIEDYEVVWKGDLNSTVQYLFQEKGKLDSVVSSGQEVQEAEEEKEEGEKLNKMSKEAEKAEEEVEREENVSAQAIQQEISELVEEEA